jgi:hypothetical protein
MRTIILLLIVLAALPAWGQYGYPATASTALIFPHLTDGGPADQRWKVTLVFTNPNTTNAANVRIRFWGDNGSPLILDFGEGLVSQIDLVVPAGGTRLITSAGTSSSANSGWGFAISNVPISGTIFYQASRNGTPFWDVSAPGTGPTYFYTSYANENLGVAVVNPSELVISLKVAVRASNGSASSAGPWYVDLPARNHRVFNLFSLPGFPRPFEGNVTISGSDDRPIPFSAWTLNFRDGLLTPLPQGEMQSPAPPDRRPYDIGYKIRQAGAAVQAELGPFLGGKDPTVIANLIRSMGLVVDLSPTITAYFKQSDNSIHVTTALVELMGESDGGLAFIIAHMATHGVFLSVGAPAGSGLPAPEQYADAMAALSLIKGGFDGAGAGDFFARLQLAVAVLGNVDPAFRNEFGLPDGIVDRLHALANNVDGACDVLSSSAALHATCEKAHYFWYPSSYAIPQPL